MTEVHDVLSASESWVREAVDPTNILPPVTFTPDQRLANYYDTDTDRAFSIHRDLDRVGEAVLDEHVSGDLFFAWINIDKTYRKTQKGLGLASYVLAIETAHSRGRNFASGHSQSQNAKRIWDILLEAKVAEINDDWERLGMGVNGEPYYSGTIKVPLR